MLGVQVDLVMREALSRPLASMSCESWNGMTAEPTYTDYLVDILDAIVKTEQFLQA